MPSKELAPVNPEVAAIMERMEPKHVALLILKILNPGATLNELAAQVWPDVQYDMKRRHVFNSGVGRVIGYLAARPYQLGLLLNGKMMPLAVATLYQCLTAPKDNVRVSAAKEIVRLAQTTASRLYASEDEPGPTDELDEALKDAGEVNDGQDEGESA
jgi:hypothetical protein